MTRSWDGEPILIEDIENSDLYKELEAFSKKWFRHDTGTSP